MNESGLSAINYSGCAKLTYAYGEHEFVFEGTFEIRQLETGRMEIRFVVVPPTSGFRFSFYRARDFNISFRGRDTDGWNLESSGKFLSVPPPFMLMKGRRDFELYPLHLEARLDDTAECEFDQAQFLISTLLWHEHDSQEPEPFEFEVRGFRVSVSPVADYLTVASRIMNGGGAEPTAYALVKSLDGKELSLQSYADFMNDLVYVFRLAFGAGVEWYYGEAFETYLETPKERVHKFAMHGPFSNVSRTLVPKPDFSELSQAFFDDKERVIDWEVAKELINAFVGACDDSLPLELRGLLASALTDSQVAQYLKKRKIGDVIPKEEYDKTVFPILKNAINEVELCKEWKQQVLNSLQGAYRRSFRQCLKLSNEGLDLGLNAKKRSRVVSIRNELVHRVTYPSQFEKWSNDYHLLIWINFVFLCRLMGYRGEMPLLRQDWELEK
ncbi:MAG: hypothetical protein OXK78_06140 [Caldilineaceae bacterium]|nr:hypothetical protein [Caldilineaceae bacterium]